ncbi:MAG TPA: flagellar basal body P-ring formation chaperone FlgA [Bryobacteraceae bacterium]|jgi:flagella basal body P-ring formation protein FlgA|nr:flagellar basal body P-ring formation chaperone FlgA [Bryobacteraceae bacterium]
MLQHFLLSAVVAASLQASAERSTCTVVDGEYILAKNVATTYPKFLALEGDTMLSYAPAPGSRRSVPATEISGWAQSHGLAIHAKEGTCFERAGVTLTAQDYREAIRNQLKGTISGTEIDVLDFDSHILPPGRLELPVSGAALPPPDRPETAFLWRGRLISSGGASYPVWARVRVVGKRDVVRAVRNLAVGTILKPDQLTSAMEQGNPLGRDDSEPLTFYVGKSLTRSVTRGSRLYRDLVQHAPAVRRGDNVRVAVASGLAHLELDALADAAGYVGDSIQFRNPSGSGHFRALITGPGRAEIFVNIPDEDTKHRTPVPTFASRGSL